MNQHNVASDHVAGIGIGVNVIKAVNSQLLHMKLWQLIKCLYVHCQEAMKSK